MDKMKAARMARQAIINRGQKIQAEKIKERQDLLARGALPPHPEFKELSTAPLPLQKESNNDLWLKRIRHLGIKVSEEDLETARLQLEAKYDKPLLVIDDPAGRCPQCGGQGVLKLNSEANPSDSEFGRLVVCSDQFHAEQRSRELAAISGLSLDELDIRLAQCEKKHDKENLYRVPGQSLMVPRSNVEMLDAFEELAKDPYGDKGIVAVVGPWGTGKTFAAMGLVNEINLANKGPAMYIILGDLLEFLKEAYDSDAQEKDPFKGWSHNKRYKFIAQSRVMVVDEFDLGNKNGKSSYNIGFVQRWVNDRYRLGIYNRALTVLLSNEPVDKMCLGSISSRLSDGRCRTIFNTLTDLRPSQVKK